MKIKGSLSKESEFNREDGSVLGEFIPDENALMSEEEMLKGVKCESLLEALGILTEKEMVVIKLRYAFIKGNSLPLVK